MESGFNDERQNSACRHHANTQQLHVSETAMIDLKLALRLTSYTAIIAGVCLGGILSAADQKSPPPTLLGKKLVFFDDFESRDMSRWQPTDKTAWKLNARRDNHIYSLI